MAVDKHSLRQWVNLSAIILAFITNIVSNLVPIGGMNVGQIANKYFNDVLVLPANFAFSIWGLIYIGLIGFGFYAASKRNKYHPRLEKIGYWLALASVAQIFWIILFQYQAFTTSVIAMLVILISLIILYRKLHINLVSTAGREKWFIDYPISLYLGWISVATIVNIASALRAFNWDGWGISNLVWAVTILLVATALGIYFALKRNDRVYPGVLVWAFLAIAIKHIYTPFFATVTIVLAIVLALFMIVPQFSKNKLKSSI
ncbi:MAG: hypothetical protein N5P05_003843 [Chroococcopsis gigantea SAG 12.99]|jgi:hypothetical protein|nr:tryptophan-rich sensory protein [Chlorogloea purpurea SAG 13.99]MDV3002237.1 hypothetical protein [Chroococcopsis gigantea SAG 12.99]